jgi:hypothetical protein
VGETGAPLAFVVATGLCLILSLVLVRSEAQAANVIAQVSQLLEERHGGCGARELQRKLGIRGEVAFEEENKRCRNNCLFVSS